MRRTARRFSLCHDDAEEALQRSLEILLRKAPGDDPRHLIKWMQTVVKREAMAVRRERERILAGPAAVEPEPGMEDWVSLLPAESEGPPERAEREETVARSREALRALKPHELRALSLLAHGYSYLEIGEITGFSATKINRSLAEGRERFRRMIARSEGGQRCGEMKPLLSAFCDGQVTAAEVGELREHLRACAHCRATLRAYRAAPAATAALAPALPLHRSLWERAHDALGELARRFGGSGSAPGTVAGSGVGGTGFAGLAKAAALCIGAGGGAAACLAGGLVPSPLAAEPERPARLERQLTEAPKPRAAIAKVDYEPAPAPAPEPKPAPVHEPKPSPPPPEPPAEGEPAPQPAPALPGEAVEYEPPPAPEAEPAPVASSGDSPAGEFGP